MKKCTSFLFFAPIFLLIFLGNFCLKKKSWNKNVDIFSKVKISWRIVCAYWFEVCKVLKYDSLEKKSGISWILMVLHWFWAHNPRDPTRRVLIFFMKKITLFVLLFCVQKWTLRAHPHPHRHTHNARAARS